MNLLGLRYFIAVTDYASFTKAAEHLFVTQPTLSRQISDLENEMGTALFIRGHHALKLTAAGKRFFKEAQKITNQVDHLKDTVNPSADNQAGILKIGYQSFLDTSLMYDIVKQVSQKYPDIEMPLFRGTPAELRNQLVTHQCDVVFTLTPCIEGFTGIDYLDLQKNQIKLAVPHDHPLAKQKSVDPKELADENFILLNRQVSPFIVDYMISLCMQNGFSPNATYYVNDAERALMLAGAGKGITFLHSMNKVSSPIKNFGIQLLDIAGQIDNFNFVLAYREKNRNPLLSVFTAEASQYLKQIQQRA
ncbi:LysR family transcriptional regulator [Secundilactobacillus folii]|uniref:LysR family transcriptional regulator n=1 Tax=Secundilactobacillus folii TaxID=2678357 RepID=A0A7X2XWC1_9LACO|nr:LysR family transcriptional regulator [Secundilactobacillus folii]MTV81486.1 LysR family transcriptional regulator [Secundilactobacillus folii]